MKKRKSSKKGSRNERVVGGEVRVIRAKKRERASKSTREEGKKEQGERENRRDKRQGKKEPRRKQEAQRNLARIK